MRILSRWQLTGLLGILLGLPAVILAQGSYDPTPAPVDINSAEITASLPAVQNSLFFLRDVAFSGKLNVDYDGFLLPNGIYAKPSCTWSKLISKTGTNMLRAPTEKEKAQEKYNKQPCLYVKEGKDEPASADGIAQLRIPNKFAHVTFSAAEVNTTQQAAPITVTLQECKGNAVSLLVQGTLTEESIVVLRDATGGRLKVPSSSFYHEEDTNDYSFQYESEGTIAKVEVFYPTEFTSVKLDIHAETEPNIADVDHPVTKAARYIPDSALQQGSTVDMATLKAQAKVIARRNYTMSSFNTPIIVLKLPYVANSAAAQVEFGTAKLYDSKGKIVPFTLEEESYDASDASCKIRFNGAGDFARAVGTVKIRYPGTVGTVTLTATQPSNGNYAVRFDGAKVAIKGIENAEMTLQLSDDFICAYDASGRRLKQLNYSGNTTEDNVNWSLRAYWGTPVEIRIAQQSDWLTLTIPYDLPPAPKLPEKQKGTRPAEYE